MYKTIIDRKHRGEFNPFKEHSSIPSHIISKDYEEAIVIDCVINDGHPEYSMDGYNVGAVKFKLKDSNVFRDESTLNWAWPLDPTISEYPLLNEMVIIHRVLNRYFYSRPINVSNKPTNQAFFGLREELGASKLDTKKIEVYERVEAGVPLKKTSDNSSFILGKYFQNNSRIYRLKHDEGDKVIEGRSGQSIRFGHAWNSDKTIFKSSVNQSPNLILRIASTQVPSIESSYGLVQENINTDDTSIWMTSNQIVNFVEPTRTSESHKKSIEDYPPAFDGSQAIVNSDSVVISAKKNKIMGFSKSGIHWTSSKNFTVDTDQDYLSYIGNNSRIIVGNISEIVSTTRFSVNSPKIYLGSIQDRTHPMVLGDILSEFLDNFLKAHIDNGPDYVVTAVGPGSLSPRVVTALKQLQNDVKRGKYASFNSLNVYGS